METKFREIITTFLGWTILWSMAIEGLCDKYGIKTALLSWTPGPIPASEFYACTSMGVIAVFILLYALYLECKTLIELVKEQ